MLACYYPFQDPFIGFKKTAQSLETEPQERVFYIYCMVCTGEFRPKICLNLRVRPSCYKGFQLILDTEIKIMKPT